jgi:hypothetical protein
MKKFTLDSILNLQFALDHTEFSKQDLQKGLDYLNNHFTDPIFNLIKDTNLTICPDGNSGGFYKFELEAILNNKQKSHSEEIKDDLVNKTKTIFETAFPEDIWNPTIRTTSIQDIKFKIILQIIIDIPY